jgi:hypothetical protein
MLSALVNFGVDVEQPEWLQIKVRLCNTLTYLIGFMAVSFLAVTYIYFRSIAIIPAAAIILCVANPIFNRVGFVTLSRFIISIVPVSLAILFISCMTNAGEKPDYGLWAMALSLLILPFVLFDYKEIVLSSLCFGFGVILLSMFNTFNSSLEFSLPEQSVVDILELLSLTTAIITIFSSLFFLSHESRRSEVRNTELVMSVEKSKQVMEESNKKLQTSMTELTKMREEDNIRQWIGNGISEMLQIGRRSTDPEKIFDQILKQIVSYTEANQAALFFNDKERKVLKLTSCYAYSRKKFMSLEIGYGIGLVGQCFFERNAIYITDVPKDYIKITSGLGEALPRCVYISPLINNDSVEGILELAFFTEMTPQQQEFINKASEYVANLISDATKAKVQEKLTFNYSEISKN